MVIATFRVELDVVRCLKMSSHWDDINQPPMLDLPQPYDYSPYRIALPSFEPDRRPLSAARVGSGS